MFTHEWAVDTFERVVSTAVQTALGIVVVSGTDWLDVNVWQTAGIAAVAAALSALKSAIATKFGSPSTASLVK